MGEKVSISTTRQSRVILKFARLVRESDEKGIVQRRAGFAFKNMKVSGSGSAINLQRNVGSVLMMPFRLGELFSRGPEKTILKSFDGCMKSGEMLIVLGRKYPYSL